MNVIKFPRIFYWTPLFQIVVLVLGTMLSFIIALLNGTVNMYLPFISETGAFVPEMGILSFTFVIGSFIGIIMISYRYVLIKASLPTENEILQRLNMFSFYIGVISMLGLAGVAVFPMTTVFWVHILFAGLFFFLSVVYILTVTVFGFKKDGLSSFIKLRIGLSICIIILVLILIVCFPISLKRWHEFNAIIPALKKPGNIGFTLVLISSIMEWSFMGVVLVFTFTFLVEFKAYHQLTLSVSAEENVLATNNPCDQADYVEAVAGI